MNCDNCGRVVYPNQTKCHCGAKIYRQPTFQSPRHAPSLLTGVLSQRFGEKLREVNDYVACRRQSHPGTTKREACLAYLREHGLMGALPEALRRENDAEARAEREAIQAESTP